MSEDYITRRLFRQANQFEALAKAMPRKTEMQRAMARVAEGMVKICEMLAEIHMEVPQ